MDCCGANPFLPLFSFSRYDVIDAVDAFWQECPWVPVIGNHESTLGSEHDIDESTEERYLNQAWGVIFGQHGAESET